jgi:hypothetical protein
MLCLVMKCGTGVGVLSESGPRSAELYTKCDTPFFNAASMRALPCVSSLLPSGTYETINYM